VARRETRGRPRVFLWAKPGRDGGAILGKVKEYFVKQIPPGRMGTPAEIAPACLFLASGEADCCGSTTAGRKNAAED